jgi:hypothetical protein
MGVRETGGFASGIDPRRIQQLKFRDVVGTVPHDIIKAKAESGAAHFGMVGGDLNANKLEKAGWAVMYGKSVDDKIKTSVSPLIDYRRKQVGNDKLFRTLDPPPAGMSAADWLLSQNTSLNVVDPKMGVPYYVMIVASPEDISFEFQYELDLYWAVGRLWLETPGDFERYAQSVVAYENPQTPVPTTRKMVLFAPDYGGADNGAQKGLLDNLVTPLIANLDQTENFRVQSFAGEKATKGQLNDILAGTGGTPAILFTGSHGLLVEPDKPYLAGYQGAIMCQDWKGEKYAPAPDDYYAAQDMQDLQNAKVHGMVYFMFDCYGLGWPMNDTYTYDGAGPRKISPAPMMANLPQKLLGRENGALAVLGHIDRAFQYSYERTGHLPQDQSFRDVLTKLMEGYPVGSATDVFNLGWAALSTTLADTLQQMQSRPDLKEEAGRQWLARDDLRNFIVHGDPAVRLRVDEKEMPPLGQI